MKKLQLSLVGLFMLFAQVALGQAISITTIAGAPYTQNFGVAAGTVATSTWTNNSTFPAWYAEKSLLGAVTSWVLPTAVANTGELYNVGSAVGTTPNFFNNATSLTADRNLGIVPNGASGPIAVGVQFQNNLGGGAALPGLSVSFNGEQFRKAITVTSTLLFSYKVSATALTTPEAASGEGTNGWVAFTAGNFTSPVVNGSAVAFTDGNAAGRTAYSNLLLPVSVPNGQFVMLRWRLVNAASTQGLGVDDISVAGANVPFVNYNQVGVDPSVLASWINTVSPFNAPANFSDPFQRFTLVNANNTISSGTFNVTGNLSKIIVGSGITLTLASSSAASTTTIDVLAGGALSLQSSTLPILGALAGAVSFDQGTAVTVPANNYADLATTGAGTKSFATGTYNVSGNLSLNSPVDFAATSGANVAAALSLINLTGNLSVGSNLSYATTSYPTLNTAGTGNQTFTGVVGRIVNLYSLTSIKAAGSLNLSGLLGGLTVAGSTVAIAGSGVTTLNYTGSALFTAAPAMSFAGSLNADGASAANYAMTGGTQTFTAGAAFTAINIRNTSGASLVPVCALGDVVMTTATSNAVARNINIGSAGGGTLLMRSLSMTMTTGSVVFSNNTIRITNGNLSISAPADLLTEGTSTLQMASTGNISSTVVGETFNNLLVTSAGATFSSDITVSGNLTGPLTGANNRLTLSGAATQTVTGAIVVRNLTSNNTSIAGAVLAAGASVSVSGVITATLSNTKLDGTAGTLVLDVNGEIADLTAVTGTAITNLTNVSAVPALNVGATGAWHFVAAPLAGQTANNFLVNNPAAPQTFNTTHPNQSSIYKYDQTNTAYPVELGWSKFSAGTNPTAVGEGYRVWCRKDNFYSVGNGRLSGKGNPQMGAFVKSLAFCASGCAYGVANGGAATNGWNLAANPYLADISWTAVGKTNTDVTYYAWNGNAGTYATYKSGDPTGTNGGTNVIAKGQAFLTLANGPAASLTFAENNKLAGRTGTILRTGSEAAPYLKLAANDGTTNDELLVQLTQTASSDFVANEDALKLANAGLTFSALSADGKSLVIDQREATATRVSLALARGSYPITISLVENTAEVTPFLETAAGKLTALKGGSFTVDSETDAQGLTLVLVPASVTGTKKLAGVLSVAPNPTTGQVTLVLPDATPSTLEVMDATGRVVATQAVTNQARIWLPGAAGLYLIRVSNASYTLEKRVLKN